jgi:hypothetical protein
VLEIPISNLLVEVSSIVEIDSCTSITIMAKGKAHMHTQAKEVEESIEDIFTSTQCLSIKVKSHSSTISFSLDTLVEH